MEQYVDTLKTFANLQRQYLPYKPLYSPRTVLCLIGLLAAELLGMLVISGSYSMVTKYMKHLFC